MTATTLPQRIREEAKEIGDMFETKQRPDGTDYVTCSSESDAKALMYALHQDILNGGLPDDWLYETARNSLVRIAEDEYTDEWDLADDQTSDLLRWALASPIYCSYTDDAMIETRPESLWNALKAGQAAAIHEITERITYWLAAYVQTRPGVDSPGDSNGDSSA